MAGELERAAETDRNLRTSLAWLFMTIITDQVQATLRGEAMRAIAKTIELRTGVDPLPEFTAVHRIWFHTGEWEMEL